MVKLKHYTLLKCGNFMKNGECEAVQYVKSEDELEEEKGGAGVGAAGAGKGESSDPPEEEKEDEKGDWSPSSNQNEGDEDEQAEATRGELPPLPPPPPCPQHLVRWAPVSRRAAQVVRVLQSRRGSEPYPNARRETVGRSCTRCLRSRGTQARLSVRSWGGLKLSKVRFATSRRTCKTFTIGK